MDTNILEEEDINLPLEEFLKFIEGKNFNELKFREEPLIFELIERGKFDIIERLFLSGKIDMTIRNSDGSTPLHVCCNVLPPEEESLPYGQLQMDYKRNIQMVKLFLDRGVDVNIRNKRRLTPLHEACIGGNIEMITFLLDRGADVNAKMKWGNTPLFCIPIDDIKIAELLLDRGADINEKEDTGLTALDSACENLSIIMVEFLLQRGAKVSYENDIPTCINYKLHSLEKNKEILELIESYKGKNIKGGRR